MHRTVSFAHLSTAVILGVWLGIQLASPAVAQDRVRAKVGIQVRSGERTAPAKTTETVKTGDELRVYVLPEDESYVYVVHNDVKSLTLLNAQNRFNATLDRLPGWRILYQDKFAAVHVRGDR